MAHCISQRQDAELSAGMTPVSKATDIGVCLTMFVLLTSILTVNGNNLKASYEGGDGNDLTLTVVP